MEGTRPQAELDEAMVDLLVKQVTEGLSPGEQRALDVLDSEVASANLREFERAAAALTLAGNAAAVSLPAVLAQKLQQRASEHIAAVSGARDDRPVRDPGAARSASSSRSGVYGWLAAAACLVLAVFAWMREPAVPPVAVAPPTVVTPPTTVAPSVEKPVPTAAEQRAALLASADSLKVTLSATKDPAAAGVTGDVVWDPVTQRGFLHFAGLAANDPAVRQYQLWIFDAGRDKRFPVDGGVFDVPAGMSDVVIPIRATLMVRKPAAFAVTVEKPGGAVVSGREHVVALGAAS
jgi:Anti-sigma-K factor rskA